MNPMYQLSVPMMDRMLDNLSNLLGKAQTHAQAENYDANVLIGTRLFPNMFGLGRQIQITCDFAKGTCARLAGVDIPKFEDNEQTIAEFQERIAKTIGFLRSLPESGFENSAEKTVEIPLPNQTLRMEGWAYLHEFALPNFYFHLTTAYNLLRHNGIPIGKKDFLGSI